MSNTLQQCKTKLEALCDEFRVSAAKLVADADQISVDIELETPEDCPICGDQLGAARTKTKCGHEFCTECLLNCVAKNTGTVEGTTRHLCPMCREPLCEKVEMDAHTADAISRVEANANHWYTQHYNSQSTVERLSSCVEQREVYIKRLGDSLVAAVALLEPATRKKFLLDNPPDQCPRDSPPPRIHTQRYGYKCGNCHEVGHNRRTCRAVSQLSTSIAAPPTIAPPTIAV